MNKVENIFFCLFLKLLEHVAKYVPTEERQNLKQI